MTPSHGFIPMKSSSGSSGPCTTSTPPSTLGNFLCINPFSYNFSSRDSSSLAVGDTFQPKACGRKSTSNLSDPAMMRRSSRRSTPTFEVSELKSCASPLLSSFHILAAVPLDVATLESSSRVNRTIKPSSRTSLHLLMSATTSVSLCFGSLTTIFGGFHWMMHMSVVPIDTTPRSCCRKRACAGTEACPLNRRGAAPRLHGKLYSSTSLSSHARTSWRSREAKADVRTC